MRCDVVIEIEKLNQQALRVYVCIAEPRRADWERNFCLVLVNEVMIRINEV